MAKQERKVGPGGKAPKKESSPYGSWLKLAQLKEEPSTYRGWLRLARLIVTECQLSDCCDRAHALVAAAAFDRAIDLLRNHPTAWLEMGQHLVRAKAGREPQTREALMRAVSIDPRNARAWMWLG